VDDPVTINFVNSDIESTVKAVGVITGKNFVIDPKVKGTINIVSNQPVARSLIFPIRIRHASALDVAQTIGRLMPEVSVQGIASPMPIPEGVKRTVIATDVRNNQLLVRSQATAISGQIRAPVKSLDTPAASGSNINIVYLRNAEAVALADTLKGILTGSGESFMSSGFSEGGASLTSGSGLGGTGRASTSADSTTNALVIDKLDVRWAQICIEALIAEVNVSRSEKLGVQWAAGGRHNSVQGGVLSDLSPTATNLGALYTGYLRIPR
jgi:general secretion pathway protein D